MVSHLLALISSRPKRLPSHPLLPVMSTPITTISEPQPLSSQQHSKRKWCGDQDDIGEGEGVTPQDDQSPKRSRSGPTSRRRVAIAPWPPVAGNSSTPLPQQSFTFVSNPERFSLASNRPPLAVLTDEINLTPCGSSHDRHTARSTSLEAGPTTADLRKSLVAFDFNSDRRKLKLNREYGFCKSKKYFFTSPLSPEPKRRKKPRSHMRRAKKSSNSLLKAALERNLTFSLQKRKDLYYNPVPLLEEDDDDDDEFDDDEEDEIIDFDDDDNESQLTDIVSMYTRETTPEPDLAMGCEVPCNHGEAIVVEEGGIKCIAAAIPIVAKSAPVGKPTPPSHSIPLLRSLGKSWSPNSLIPSLVSSKALPAFPVTI